MVSFKLEKILKRKNMTRYALSKLTDIDNNTLSKIYYNKSTQIRLDTIDKICDALSCEVSDLIEYKKNKN